MKYEFKKNGEDDYSLIYKNNIINFKSDVEAVKKLQEAEAEGKIKMIEDLAAKGKSVKSLIIEIKKDGKTYYDNTNKIEMERIYTQIEFTKVFCETIKNVLGKDYQELYNELGMESQEEFAVFSKEFGEILTGQYKFPSGQVLSKENQNQ